MKRRYRLIILLLFLSVVGCGPPSSNPQVMRTVFAWGENSHGQLGDGSTSIHTGPVQVAGLQNIDSVRAGYRHSLALLKDGTAWQWGHDWGSVIDPTYTNLYDLECTNLPIDCHPSPVPIIDENGSVVTDVRLIGEGATHSLLVRSSDRLVWAWGDNRDGKLGYTSFTGALFGEDPIPQRSSIVQQVVNGPNHIFTVTGGADFSVALQSGSSAFVVWTWGDNNRGQLGVGHNSPDSHWVGFGSMQPVQVPGLRTDIIGIYAGADYVLTLSANGTVWGWGSNDYCKITWSESTGCDVITNFKPVQVVEFINGTGYQPLNHITQIAAGCDHSLALTSEGKVLSWGDHEYGQRAQVIIGYFDPQRGGSVDIQEVKGLDGNGSKVKAIAAGCNFSLALMTDGTVMAWGDNSLGQLGVSTTETCEIIHGNRPHRTVPCSRTPVLIPGLTSVVQISAGYSHSLALVYSEPAP